MARLFPNRLPGKVPREVALAFRKLKKLPDDYSVWYSLAGSASAPHFLLLWRERFAFLLHVTGTKQELAETALQPEMFGQKESLLPSEIGNESIHVLDDFESLLMDQLDEPLPMRRLVIFPNIDQQTLDAVSMQRTQETGADFLGMNQLSERDLHLMLESMSAAPLNEKQIVHLRHQFAPETIVPDSFSPLRPADRNTAPKTYTGLLDLDQEWCVKNNLYLSEDAAEYLSAKPSNNQLITGVAGSGKSLVLLYRAMLNAKLNPHANVLVLTHNRALHWELEGKFAQLNGSPESIQWFTFFQWMNKLLPASPDRIISGKEVQEIISEKLHSSGRFSSGFLAEEIGFIKDNGIDLLDSYFEADRRGRGKGLNDSMRREVWAVHQDYESHLKQRNLIDWHGVALRFRAAVSDGTIRFPSYDCILVDEAQFFAKVWFDIVTAALKPTGELFLAADPTQGFLKRGQSWISSGIDVRGRSRRLTHAYRNSRCILRFATAFATARKLEAVDDKEINLPDQQMLDATPIEGKPPEIIRCPTLLDSHRRVAEEIKKLAEHQHPNGQILVLHASSGNLNNFYQTLSGTLGKSKVIHQSKHGPRPHQAFCQVCTLNAATGLEAPIVFLLGIDTLLENEGSPHLTEDERQSMSETHTRKLYMGITRAAQRLVISTENPATEILLKQLVNS